MQGALAELVGGGRDLPLAISTGWHQLAVSIGDLVDIQVSGPALSENEGRDARRVSRHTESRRFNDQGSNVKRQVTCSQGASRSPQNAIATGCARTRCTAQHQTDAKPAFKRAKMQVKCGGAGGVRTRDRRIMSPLL
jgi:hypothetical protein